MIEWHHRPNEHEFEQTPGDSEGQGSLACCSPSSCKESDMTQQLNSHLPESVDAACDTRCSRSKWAPSLHTWI